MRRGEQEEGAQLLSETSPLALPNSCSHTFSIQERTQVRRQGSRQEGPTGLETQLQHLWSWAPRPQQLTNLTEA